MKSNILTTESIKEAVMKDKKVRAVETQITKLVYVVEALTERIELLEDRLDRLVDASRPFRVTEDDHLYGDSYDDFDDYEDDEDEDDEDEEDPIIIRHGRYYDDNGDVSNLGGVTYAFRIDHVEKVAYVGLAICSKEDNFDRRTGRNIAISRLENEPFGFEFESGDNDGLVAEFWDSYNNDQLVASPAEMVRMVESANLEGLEDY